MAIDWGQFVVARSPSMLAILAKVERFLASVTPLVIRGPTGSGKNHLAEAIHRGGERSEKPLVTWRPNA